MHSRPIFFTMPRFITSDAIKRIDHLAYPSGGGPQTIATTAACSTLSRLRSGPGRGSSLRAARTIVSIGHTLHLAVVSPDGSRSCSDRHPGVEVLQREDSAPRSRSELLLFQPVKFLAIGGRQLQAR